MRDNSIVEAIQEKSKFSGIEQADDNDSVIINEEDFKNEKFNIC